MQVGRGLFKLWALRRTSPGNYRNFQRINAWLRLRAVFWIAGGVRRGAKRGSDCGRWRSSSSTCRPVARLLDAGPRALDHGRMGHRRQPHGRALRPVRHHRARRIDPGHRREIRHTAVDAATVAAFVVVVRRQRGDVVDLLQHRCGGGQPAHLPVPAIPAGWRALAYTYVHLPLVAGIIVAAVGDELVLAHPTGHTGPQDRPPSCSAGRRSTCWAISCSRRSRPRTAPPCRT